MTEKEFSDAMKPILQDFGPLQYPPNRMKLIFDICKDLPEINFKAVVTFFLETKPIQYPPLPNDFRDAANTQRKHLESIGRHKPRNHQGELQHTSKTIEQLFETLPEADRATFLRLKGRTTNKETTS